MALPAGRYGVTKRQLNKIKNLPMNTIEMIEESAQAQQQLLEDTVGWIAENLIVEADMIDGKTINAEGVESDNANVKHTGLTPVEVGKKYIFRAKHSREASNTFRVHGYDSNGDWVKQITYATISGIVYFEIPFTVDSGISGVKITMELNTTEYTLKKPSVDEQKADNSVIAPVENGTTASQAYAVGSHFIRNGKFCTVTTAISADESLVGSSKFTEGDVASELLQFKRVFNSANDLNSITQTGIYGISTSPVNAPESVQYCALIVQRTSSNDIRQIIFRSSATNGLIYIRTYSGIPATWKPWTKFEGTVVS